MELNTTKSRLQADPVANELVTIIEVNAERLDLENCKIYYRFPLYRGEGRLEEAKLLIVSPWHGVLVVETTSASRGSFESELRDVDQNLDIIFGQLHGRLTRHRTLRRSKKELLFQLEPVIFAPRLSNLDNLDAFDAEIINDVASLAAFLSRIKSERISDRVLAEIASVIEGAKGIIVPQAREVPSDKQRTRAQLVNELEAEIANFDADQKHGYMEVIGGPQRIRGLAGSGKTVVLAMKAALTHLRHPDATIIYTYYTRSLHQHVRRLITRFYRQFDDRDPNWNKLRIMHAWGGASKPGVYSEACALCGTRPLTYSDVSGARSPFDAACEDLLTKAEIPEAFDYVFVDEGQDFPASFLRICLQLSKGKKLVYAYDELQNIFQTEVPSVELVFGQGFKLEEDIVLKKCYRNPREVLVSAHALGFGLYGERIVQMLENEAHWEDLGYVIEAGELSTGSHVRILRPDANSPSSISKNSTFEEIVSVEVLDSADKEVESVGRRIVADISKEGLRPEDVVAICVDDKFARAYFGALSNYLQRHGIDSNNIVGSASSGDVFYRDDAVTLSSIHRAKGNEGYSVYVMGVDALSRRAGIRSRNMIFTALTRAKAWVHVTGVGSSATKFQQELRMAAQHFPYLEFVYPDKDELQIMKRDLRDTPEERAEKTVEDLLEVIDVDDLAAIIEKRRKASKGKFRR